MVMVVGGGGITGINSATIGSISFSGSTISGLSSITGLGVGSLPDDVIAGRLLSVNTYTNDSGSADESFGNMTNGGSWTWTKPTGCKKVLVYCTGAGAGSASNDTAYRGWTGGGGATAIGWFDVTAVSTVSVTTGTGSQGVRGMSRPGTGGTSSFGSYCSATGGVGGGESPYGGGRGGTATGGNVANIPGGGGEGSHSADVEMGGGGTFWHRTGGAHNNGTGQGDNDYDRRLRLKGRFGSGAGTCYGSEHASESWRSGGAGIVVVYSYS